jgi:endogenous inhibitor of DNA gyrase (YacG/DUF329 family)
VLLSRVTPDWLKRMTRPSDTPADRTLRRVRCPSCGAQTVYAPTQPHRPFCSERCRKMDLGAWASENFRVPTEAPPEEQGFGDPRLQ